MTDKNLNLINDNCNLIFKKGHFPEDQMLTFNSAILYKKWMKWYPARATVLSFLDTEFHWLPAYKTWWNDEQLNLNVGVRSKLLGGIMSLFKDSVTIIHRFPQKFLKALSTPTQLIKLTTTPTNEISQS